MAKTNNDTQAVGQDISAPDEAAESPITRAKHRRLSQPDAGEEPRSPRSPKRLKKDDNGFPDYESGRNEAEIVSSPPPSQPPLPKIRDMKKRKQSLGAFQPRNSLNGHAQLLETAHNRKREASSPASGRGETFRHSSPNKVARRSESAHNTLWGYNSSAERRQPRVIIDSPHNRPRQPRNHKSPTHFGVPEFKTVNATVNGSRHTTPRRDKSLFQNSSRTTPRPDKPISVDGDMDLEETGHRILAGSRSAVRDGSNFSDNRGRSSSPVQRDRRVESKHFGTKVEDDELVKDVETTQSLQTKSQHQDGGLLRDKFRRDDGSSSDELAHDVGGAHKQLGVKSVHIEKPGRSRAESDSEDGANMAAIKPSSFTRSGLPVPSEDLVTKPLDKFSLNSAWNNGQEIDGPCTLESSKSREHPQFSIVSASGTRTTLPLRDFVEMHFSFPGKRAHFLKGTANGNGRKKLTGWCHLEFSDGSDQQQFKLTLRSVFGIGLSTKITDAPDRSLCQMLEAKTGKKVESASRTGLSSSSTSQQPRKQKLTQQLKDEDGVVAETSLKDRPVQPTNSRLKRPSLAKREDEHSRIKYEEEPAEDEVTEVQPPLTRRSQRAVSRRSLKEPSVDLDRSVERYSVVHGLGEPWAHPLIYPPQGQNKATVEYSDLYRLDEDEFLNDNLISFYLRYIQEEFSNVNNKVYFFNTYFYETLTKPPRTKYGVNYDAVKRWTSKINLFDYDHIVVPINENLHWHAAIICNVRKMVEDIIELSDDDESVPGVDKRDASSSSADLAMSPGTKPIVKGTSELTLDETPSSSLPTEKPLSKTQLINTGKGKSVAGWSPETPGIISIDSLGTPHGEIARILKGYMQAEAEEKLGKTLPPLQGVTAKGIPLQQNYCDCGLYLLGYIAKFITEPDNFVGQILARQMHETRDWPDLNPREMRNQIRNIIQEKHKQQEENRVPTVKKKKKPLTDQAESAPSHPDPLEQLTGTPVKAQESRLSDQAGDTNAIRSPPQQHNHKVGQDEVPLSEAQMRMRGSTPDDPIEIDKSDPEDILAVGQGLTLGSNGQKDKRSPTPLPISATITDEGSDLPAADSLLREHRKSSDPEDFDELQMPDNGVPTERPSGGDIHQSPRGSSPLSAPPESESRDTGSRTPTVFAKSYIPYAGSGKDPERPVTRGK